MIHHYPLHTECDDYAEFPKTQSHIDSLTISLRESLLQDSILRSGKSLEAEAASFLRSMEESRFTNSWWAEISR